MKNFFKKLFGKKKYPERTEETIESIRIVYAGPDFRMKKRKANSCVYAGPEMMGKGRNRDRSMEGVYAGPEEMPGRTTMRRVYAGPSVMNKKRPSPSEMEDVYMGPEP